MRILMLSPHARIRSPLTKHTPHLVDSLVRLGCSVEWAPWGRRHEAESLSNKLTERFRDVLQIRRRVAKRQFDALVIKTSHDASTLARDIPLVLLTRRHVPCIVVQFHGSSPWMLLEPGRRVFKTATKLLLHLIDGAMVLSAEEQRNWLKFSPSRTPFIVKNPFVAPRELQVEHVPRRAAQRTHEATDFLFVGRLLEQKGVFELIDALSEVAQRSSCRLTFVGDGPAAPRLKQQVQALGLSERVSFRGYLQDDGLASAYRAADVLVLPSWSEGFPTVITEAMFAGLPIVTTQVGGAMDHLVEGEHALFVPPHDVPMLSAALLRLSEDSRLRVEMGNANQERVRIFAPERVGREYLAVLKQIAASADDRSPSGRSRLGLARLGWSRSRS